VGAGCGVSVSVGVVVGVSVVGGAEVSVGRGVEVAVGDRAGGSVGDEAVVMESVVGDDITGSGMEPARPQAARRDSSRSTPTAPNACLTERRPVDVKRCGAETTRRTLGFVRSLRLNRRWLHIRFGPGADLRVCFGFGIILRDGFCCLIRVRVCVRILIHVRFGIQLGPVLGVRF
jgi:hypothetical protein